MPEVCDIVDEAASATDSPVHYFVNSATELASGLDALLSKLTQAMADAATGSDSVADQFAILVGENASASDSIAQTMVGRNSIAESAVGADLAINVRYQSVADESSASDSQHESVKQIIRETGIYSESFINQLLTRQLVSESAVGSDLPTGWLQMAVAETASGSDAIASSLYIMQTVGESSTGTDAVDQQAAFRTLVSESASGSDALLSTLTARNSVDEYATGEDVLVVNDGAAWVAGINQLPMSRWTNLPGSSIGWTGSELLIGGDGLWRAVAGDVEYSLDLGSSDFKNPMRKHLAYSYATGQINSQMNLAVQDHEEGQNEEWEYEFATEDGVEHETIRCNLGRGHRSRYFNFRLSGTGQVQLSQVAVVWEQMARRI